MSSSLVTPFSPQLMHRDSISVGSVYVESSADKLENRGSPVTVMVICNTIKFKVLIILMYKMFHVLCLCTRYHVQG